MISTIYQQARREPAPMFTPTNLTDPLTGPAPTWRMTEEPIYRETVRDLGIPGVGPAAGDVVQGVVLEGPPTVPLSVVGPPTIPMTLSDLQRASAGRRQPRKRPKRQRQRQREAGYGSVSVLLFVVLLAVVVVAVMAGFLGVARTFDVRGYLSVIPTPDFCATSTVDAAGVSR